MAASSKGRVARRIAKGKVKGGKTNIVDVKKAKREYNAKGVKLRNAIAIGVASETSTQAKAVVAQMAAAWSAINAGDMSVTADHTKRYLNDIRDGVIETRKAMFGVHAVQPVAIIATRVGDMNAQLHLHDWKCRAALIAVLNTMPGLTSQALTKIARWMRGKNGKGGKWSPDVQRAPTAKALTLVLRKGRSIGTGTRSLNNAGNRTRGAKRSNPTGMPLNEMLRSHDHCVTCLVTYEKKHRAHLGERERKVILATIASLGNIRAKVKSAATAKAQEEAKIAADEAKAKAAAKAKAKKEGK